MEFSFLEESSPLEIKQSQALEFDHSQIRIEFMKIHDKAKPKKISKFLKFDSELKKALAEYPDFISNLIKLYDLALDLDSKDLCSSIKQILLILPANDSQLITAIKKQENFEPFFNSSSIASNWYNIMILRMVLLPSDAERVISQEPKLYSYFFSSNAPHVLLRLLCSSKVSENVEIRHIETRNSLIAGLTEICRFITLVIVKRDEIEILTKRQKAPMHQNTLTVLGLIQNPFQLRLLK